ncbi:MAG: M14 family metallopeptidase [Fulvivirga sp.]
MIRTTLQFLIASFVLYSCVSSKKVGTPLSYDPPGSTNTKSKPITYQEKGSFTLGGVTANNEFDGARLNGFSQLNDSVFQIDVEPENAPINMSPWYSFKLKSETPKEIYVHLKYKDGRHRYYPDVSTDGINWSPIDSTAITAWPEDSAVLKLNLNKDYLWVSAQELRTSAYNAAFVEDISKNPLVTKHLMGQSKKGVDMNALEIALGEKKPLLIVISRQHPPEVTGYMAMQSFVGELLSESELSKQFRKEFGIIIVPMMNPDGVDNGHWRHNTGGVDLNRDWQFYNQPEIDQFQKYIHQRVKEIKMNVVLGLDFHSTHEDLLYTFNEETYSSEKGVVKKWVQQLKAAFPDESITEEDGGSDSPVSKNWFLQEFKAEGVTYEVGDDTPRDFIKEKGKVSAQLFMKLLIDKHHE